MEQRQSGLGSPCVNHTNLFTFGRFSCFGKCIDGSGLVNGTTPTVGTLQALVSVTSEGE
jgi:hypothetical protein